MAYGFSRILAEGSKIRELSLGGSELIDADLFEDFTQYSRLELGYYLNTKTAIKCGFTYHVTPVFSSTKDQDLRPYYFNFGVSYNI